MTSKYRVEYSLKAHRRDQLIEWIKGLLAVPFVLHSQPTTAYDHTGPTSDTTSNTISSMSLIARDRYADIMYSVEQLISDHIAHQYSGTSSRSKLKLLVPSVGTFFTPLLLRDAFIYQDERRKISKRRFVPPSFNDVRVTMNSAQVMSLVRSAAGPLELVTFDGDVTLYDDGLSVEPDNLVVERLMALLGKGVAVGIVTAAGYTEAKNYHGRLHGLLEAVKAGLASGKLQRPRMVVIGGESSYLFRFDAKEEFLLRPIARTDWELPAMRLWDVKQMQALLDVAQAALEECVENLGLDAEIIRKERAVGIIQSSKPGAKKLAREQLEETVLVVQQLVEMSDAGKAIPFCAFNGGSDVFVDIGDKSWGVRACQNYLGGIEGSRTLHVGDQFLSAGSNDFKARLACTTAWIANPAETVSLLDELLHHQSQAS